VLPLGPAGGGNSPYDSQSSFAGNPLLISLDDLMADDFLSADDVPEVTGFEVDAVEFRKVSQWKSKRLRRAYERFSTGQTPLHKEPFEQFVSVSADWLEDFVLYQALRGQYEKPWYQWPEPLRLRDADAIAEARQSLNAEIDYHRFVQYLFDRQWHALKQVASDHEVTIMGDIPIYVALDSADVWAHQDEFKLDEDGAPTVQAGVPPDMFSATGQLWGNPVFDWDRMRSNGFQWWQRRIERARDLTDIVRIDHFRGFAAGWQVPAGEKTAIIGEWVPGPGLELFHVLERNLGRIPVVVEDLGVITPDVEELRDALGYPGMKVLQFAFDGDAENPYLPHNYVPNSMVYSGTHDNDTTAGWIASLSTYEQNRVRNYSRASAGSEHLDMIRLAWSSVSVLSCAPVQDVIGLGSEGRMNIPGQARGNWRWRLPSLTPLRRRTRWLREMTELYGRDQPPLP
jgi:4-alpha-glucanotransferase